MATSDFGDRKENTRFGFIACALVCVAAMAISLELAIALAAFIAIGAMLFGGKTLVAGNSARL